MKNPRMSLLAALVVAATACGGQPDDQVTGDVTPETMQNVRANLPAGVAEALDAGNEAFKADDFRGALARYEEAARLGPEVPAAWFGIYMAQQALGDTTAARQAMARAQELAGSASLMHPAPGDTTP